MINDQRSAISDQRSQLSTINDQRKNALASNGRRALTAERRKTTPIAQI
jgi:hypothetical protein